MKKRILILTVSLLIVISVFNSCNDEPTTLGYSLLSDTVQLFSLETPETRLISGDSSYNHVFKTLKILDPGVFLIGKSNGFESISLLRFGEPDTNTSRQFLNFSIDKIISCKLKFHVNAYSLGDSNNPSALAFKVFKNVKGWNHSTVFDDIKPGSLYDGSKTVAQFNGNITTGNSMIEMDLDKEMALDWLKKWYELKKNITPVDTVWGLTIVPDENSSVIRQFQGLISSGNSDTVTKLSIKYLDSTDTNTVELALGTGIYKNCIKIPAYPDDKIIVDGAANTRGILNFDLSAIPDHAAINSAKLELFIDWENSFIGNLGIDSTLLLSLPDTGNYETLDVFERNILGEIQGDKFIFNYVATFIESINRGSKNIMILLPEGFKNGFQELDRLVFHGINSPDSLKHPKLTVIYTKRPGFDKEKK